MNLPSRDKPVRPELSPARRMAAWTSRGILTAVVLVVGLSFGRQVVRWWAEDEAVSASGRSAGDAIGMFDPSAEPLSVQFGGQSTTIAVRTVHGTPAEATAALRSLAEERLPEAAWPDRPVGDRERDLLAKLTQETPTAQEPGRWRLYALADEFPMVVGVVDAPRPPSRHPAQVGEGMTPEEPPTKGGRIGLWGFGFPSSSGGWTLYTFLSGEDRPDEVAAEAIPLPPGVEPTLSVGAGKEVQLAAFSGLVELGPCRGFFDRWFAENGWTTDDGWRESAGGIHATFRREDAAGGRAAGNRLADVHLARDAEQGRVRGLVTIRTDRPD
ncbi:MAG: hypothetical protein GX621_18925 [Pirellulaceae bacterium]|nr:hypothetical protein [Pirellulaceae bacterium]